MKNLLLLCICFLIISCSPSSKESYLQRYADFMNEVAEKSSSYTESDWKRSDEEFYKFSEEWYVEFETELTNLELMKLAGYELKYSYYRGVSGAGALLKELGEKSDDIMKSVDSEVSKGIKHLGEELQEITDSLGDLEKYMDDLSEKFEELGGKFGEAIQNIEKNL